MWHQVNEIDGFDEEECMVVAPDYGAGKISARHRRELGTNFLVMDKSRNVNDSQKIQRDEKAPEADGMVCLIFDDILDTAGTVVTAAEVLKNSGAKKVYVAAAHGTFSDPAFDRLKQSPIDKLLVTDTFPMTTAQYELDDMLEVVTVAPKIGQALIEIATCGSVSKVFDDENHY
jgi:ribose-phosphate pyrophosphokinase